MDGVVTGILYKLGRPSATIPSGPTLLATTFRVPSAEIEKREIRLGNVIHPYVTVCDELEQKLEGLLNGLNLPEWEFSEDYRDGETLSYRISFKWDLQEGYPVFGDISPWEVIEVKPFRVVYPNFEEETNFKK